jgi:chaperonin cofactor prefoldin
MKSKTYWIMAVWSILWLVGIGSQIKFSMNHDKLRNELNAKNDKLESRIKVYEKLADPKSVQLYVSELNGILDNMTRLIRVVESGEEIDAFFGKMENDIKAVKSMVNNIYPIVEELDNSVEAYIVRNNFRMEAAQENIDELIDDAESSDLRLIKKFDIIENDLRDIRNILNEIENSKIGSKIFKK